MVGSASRETKILHIQQAQLLLLLYTGKVPRGASTSARTLKNSVVLTANTTLRVLHRLGIKATNEYLRVTKAQLLIGMCWLDAHHRK